MTRFVNRPRIGANQNKKFAPIRVVFAYEIRGPLTLQNTVEFDRTPFVLRNLIFYEGV